MGTVEGLTRDRVKALRKELNRKFAGDRTIWHAVDSVLGDLESGWFEHQGMTEESFQLITDALLPHLERLEQIPVADAKPISEALLKEWERVAGDVEWVG